MSYTAANLHLRSGGAAGALLYYYAAGADTLAQVLAGNYFNNVTGVANLRAGDQIMVNAVDGNMMIRVAAVVTDPASALFGYLQTNYVSGDLPINTWATGTEAAQVKGRVGFMEIASAIGGTASRVVLPTPYPGAVFEARKTGSGTNAVEFDAGASASDVSIGSGSASLAGGGTGVTYDGTRRRITLVQEGTGFRVRGSSTTRRRIEKLDFNASAVSEGGSVVFLGT